jgi:uncharacterized protein
VFKGRPLPARMHYNRIMDAATREPGEAAGRIADLGKKLMEGPLGREEALSTVEFLATATGKDLVDGVHEMLARGAASGAASGAEPEKLKHAVSRLINLMSRPLDSVSFVPEDPFFRALVYENEALRRRLDDFRPLVAGIGPGGASAPAPILAALARAVDALGDIRLHYRKKENILFPVFESRYPRYRCVSLMWAIHDDVRCELDELSELLSTPEEAAGEHALALIRARAGRLFFDAHALVFREEKILFPLAAGLLEPAERLGLFRQAEALGFCFLDPARIRELELEAGTLAERLGGEGAAAARATDAGAAGGVGRALPLDAGTLSPELVDLVLRSLPVDLTFVDVEDRVAYFSNGSGRVFPRSPAIIGRDVRNCHPAKSVGRVLGIIESFRGGKRDREEFRLLSGGRFVRIEYRALRSPAGEYLGTLEISQDLTEARALEGEKRL